MSKTISQDFVNLVQITDTHLYSVPEGTLLKLNTHDSLAKVLKDVCKNEKKIDLVLATGDIAQDGSVSAYRYFIDYIGVLNAPVRWIPGNHDIPENMEKAAKGSAFGNKLETLANWRIIMLDSSRLNHVHGLINAEEMGFLRSSLKAAEADPDIDHCMVCLHHNPVPGSSSWMKDIGLRNDKEFLALLNEHEIVRAVVYGHIHQELDYMINKIRLFCSPSTCIQFKPEVIDFALDNLNPGYRRFKLFRDGSIESKVLRVKGHDFMVDHSSSGY
jgi:3',5'-cyclic-AMP phosphodiesterase